MSLHHTNTNGHWLQVDPGLLGKFRQHTLGIKGVAAKVVHDLGLQYNYDSESDKFEIRGADVDVLAVAVDTLQFWLAGDVFPDTGITCHLDQQARRLVIWRFHGDYAKKFHQLFTQDIAILKSIPTVSVKAVPSIQNPETIEVCCSFSVYHIVKQVVDRISTELDNIHRIEFFIPRSYLLKVQEFAIRNKHDKVLFALKVVPRDKVRVWIFARNYDDAVNAHREWGRYVDENFAGIDKYVSQDDIAGELKRNTDSAESGTTNDKSRTMNVKTSVTMTKDPNKNDQDSVSAKTATTTNQTSNPVTSTVTTPSFATQATVVDTSGTRTDIGTTIADLKQNRKVREGKTDITISNLIQTQKTKQETERITKSNHGEEEESRNKVIGMTTGAAENGDGDVAKSSNRARNNNKQVTKSDTVKTASKSGVGTTGKRTTNSLNTNESIVNPQSITSDISTSVKQTESIRPKIAISQTNRFSRSDNRIQNGNRNHRPSTDVPKGKGLHKKVTTTHSGTLSDTRSEPILSTQRKNIVSNKPSSNPTPITRLSQDMSMWDQPSSTLRGKSVQTTGEYKITGNSASHKFTSSKIKQSVPEPRYHTNINGLDVFIYKQNIAKMANMDALVNVVTSDLKRGDWASMDMFAAMGKGVIEEINAYIDAYGGVETGGCMVTSAGRLAVHGVIHVVSPIWRKYRSWQECACDLHTTIYNLLTTAQLYRYLTIAIPTIGTEPLFGIPSELVAEVYVTALLDYSMEVKQPGLQIHLVDCDEEPLSYLKHACSSWTMGTQAIRPKHQTTGLNTPTHTHDHQPENRPMKKFKKPSTPDNSKPCIVFAEKGSMKTGDAVWTYRINDKLTVSVYTGSLVDVDNVEAIACAVDGHLKGSMARLVMYGACEKYQQSLLQAKGGRHLSEGDVLVCEAGHLAVSTVLHSVISSSIQAASATNLARLHTVNTRLLHAARSLNIRSLAMPLIATGGLREGFDVKQCSLQLVDSLIQWSYVDAGSELTPNEIHLVNLNPLLTQYLVQALRIRTNTLFRFDPRPSPYIPSPRNGQRIRGHGQLLSLPVRKAVYADKKTSNTGDTVDNTVNMVTKQLQTSTSNATHKDINHENINSAVTFQELTHAKDAADHNRLVQDAWTNSDGESKLNEIIDERKVSPEQQTSKPSQLHCQWTNNTWKGQARVGITHGQYKETTITRENPRGQHKEATATREKTSGNNKQTAKTLGSSKIIATKAICRPITETSTEEKYHDDRFQKIPNNLSVDQSLSQFIGQKKRFETYMTLYRKRQNYLKGMAQPVQTSYTSTPPTPLHHVVVNRIERLKNMFDCKSKKDWIGETSSNDEEHEVYLQRAHRYFTRATTQRYKNRYTRDVQ